MKNQMLYAVALGANLSFQDCTPDGTLVKAIAELSGGGLVIRAISRFFRTPCFPEGAGPDYINAVVTISTHLNPEDVLARLHAIEARFGRERIQRWGQRTLDLDLITAGETVLPDRAGYDRWQALDPAMQAKAAPDRLILPHPRLQDRAFVLVPLADVMADWRHPVFDKTVSDLLMALPEADVAEVIAL